MKKTKVKLIGTDGNVFNIIGAVTSALKKDGKHELADEFAERAMSADSYEDVLAMIHDYCIIQ